MSLVVLQDDRSRVTLAPDLGAAVASFDARLPGGPAPVLRPWDGVTRQPFALACNPLVPFSNRIHGGGFTFEGVRHDVAPNHADTPVPIHGDGFQRRWAVHAASPAEAVLTLATGAIGPWRYAARVTYALHRGDLTCSLRVSNTGPALPFGGGFHPWFPRHPGTRLEFTAERVWPEEASRPATAPAPVRGLADRDFSTATSLPNHLIDHAFSGWSGVASILQPELGLCVRVTSAMDVAIVYCPGAAADFFCFEPVAHGVDAVNAPGHPGMVRLAPGEAFEISATIGWTAA